MADIRVRELVADNEKMVFEVVVGAGQPHIVSVRRSDALRLIGQDGDVADLVRRSFVFLLAREADGSILKEFDLMEIARYFPGFPQAVMTNG